MLTNPTNSNSAGLIHSYSISFLDIDFVVIVGAPFSPQRLEASASGPNLQLIDLPPHNDEFKQVSAQFKYFFKYILSSIRVIMLLMFW